MTVLVHRLVLGGAAVALALGSAPLPPPVASSPVCDATHAPPPSSTAGAPPLVFGVFAGGNHDDPTSPLDDPAEITRALEKLQAGRGPFVVSSRVINDSGDVLEVPANLTSYTGRGRLLDVALIFDGSDVESWERFVRGAVREFGRFARSIQIGHEENFQLPGSGPDEDLVLEAIVGGVHAAKAELRNSDVLVGFNAGVDPGVDEREFFRRLGELGGRRFARAVDYVGLDVYPGLPIPPPSYRQEVADTLRQARLCWLPTAGVPDSTPLHVTENGWPTMTNEYCDGSVCYPKRTYADQVAALEEMVRAVSDYRRMYNVTTYEWFGLRDWDSSVDVKPWEGVPLPSQFGLLRDDYRPKPAFHAYRNLIARLG